MQFNFRNRGRSVIWRPQNKQKERRQNVRRSWIRPKKKVRRELWRSGRVIEDSKGMARLRSEAYHRSNGLCECRLADPNRPECTKRVNWIDGELHHMKPRSDVIDRVAFVSRACHRELTGKLQWTPILLDRRFIA
jgi:hypothetical protein